MSSHHRLPQPSSFSPDRAGVEIAESAEFSWTSSGAERGEPRIQSAFKAGEGLQTKHRSSCPPLYPRIATSRPCAWASRCSQSCSSPLWSEKTQQPGGTWAAHSAMAFPAFSEAGSQALLCTTFQRAAGPQSWWSHPFSILSRVVKVLAKPSSP